jgi:hypothetical protein
MTSKSFGAIDMTVVSAANSGGLADGDNYYVQVDVTEPLVKNGVSFRTPFKAANELEWNFLKNVKFSAKLEKMSTVRVTVLRHRTILQDEPLGYGELNLWPLWRGAPVEQSVAIIAIQSKADAAENKPKKEIAKVKVRAGWQDGNVPDMLAKMQDPGSPTAEGDPAKPGEYQGATQLADAESLPACEGQDYRVHVRLHKARNLQSVKADKLYDPMVTVKVGDQEQTSDYAKKTNNPIFDEELVFTFPRAASTFWSTPITMTVQDHYFGAINVLIGSAEMDCGTVYRENDHFAMNKWYVLHEDIATGRVKGFLKASIAVLNQRSDPIPEQEEDDGEDEDEIVSNLVPGPGARFEEVHLDCDVLRAEGLPQMDFDLSLGLNPIKGLSALAGGLADPFVKLTFGTKKIRSHHVSNTLNPVWNIPLDLPLLLPALTENLKLALWDYDLTKDDLIATHRFSIQRLIQNGGTTGLPKLDCQWITLYGHPRGADSDGIFNSYMKKMARNEVPGCDYRGRVLLRMDGSRQPIGTKVPEQPKESLVAFSVNAQIISVAMVPKGKYVVRVSVGLDKVQTGHKDTVDVHGDADQKFVPVEEEIRVNSSLKVVIPEEGSTLTVEQQIPDVIVHLHPVSAITGVDPTPYAFARFPMSAIWNKGADRLTCVSMQLLTDPSKQNVGTEPEMPLIQLALAAFSTRADPPLPQVPVHSTINMPALSGEPKSTYIIEACVYHAKQLPAGDDNGLSDPYVKVHWANGTAKTGYKLETLSPSWNQLLRVVGDCRATSTVPDIVLEVWDRDLIGCDTFLGRKQISADDAILDDLVAKPRWYTDFTDSRGLPVQGCHVLMSFEYLHATKKLLEKLPTQKRFRRKLGPNRETYIGDEIPLGKKLPTCMYKVDVEVIGLRHMRTFRLFNIRQPSIAIEVGEHRVHLDPIYGANPTFNKNFCLYAELPADPAFLPEVSFRVYEHRLGCGSLVGCSYLLLGDERCDPTRTRDREARLEAELQDRQNRILKVKQGEEPEPGPAVIPRPLATFKRAAQAIRAVAGANLFADAAVPEVPAAPSVRPVNFDPNDDLRRPLMDGESGSSPADRHAAGHVADRDSIILTPEEEDEMASVTADEFQDIWFDRFMPEPDTRVDPKQVVSRLGKLKNCGLSSGKTTAEDYFGPFDDYNRIILRRGWGPDSRVAGDILVNCLRTPLAADVIPAGGTAKDDEVEVRDIQRRRPVKILARVYIIGGSKLTAMDSGPLGKASDPYIVIRLTSNSKDAKTIEKVLKDSVRYQTLEPDWYMVEDLSGVLPKHNTLRITVMDYDKLGRDELIGYTEIDLEDRWYSRRGYSGGAGERTLRPGSYTEKRTLRNDAGQSQGTIEMWVDLYDTDKVDVPRPIDIQPPPPIELEVRATVWNTRDVQLVDSNFADDMMTDIYVRCWMDQMDFDTQQTDVHYRSLDGTGNFNWRMLFGMIFDPRTQKVQAPKTESLFAAFMVRKEPKKFKPVLRVQLFDNDLLPGMDDFIGETLLDLTNLIPANSHRRDQDIGPMESCCPCHFFPFNRCCLNRKDPRDMTLKEKQQMGRDEMVFELQCRKARFEAIADDRMQPFFDRRKRDPSAYTDRYLEKLRRKFVRDAEHESRINIFTAFMPKRQKKGSEKDLTCCALEMEAPRVSETPKYWFACRAPDGGYRSGDVQISFQLVRRDELEKDDKLAAGKGRSDPNKLPEPHRPADSFFWLSSPMKSAYYILWKHYKWYIITVILLIILVVYLFIFTKQGAEIRANSFFGGDDTQKIEVVTPAPA